MPPESTEPEYTFPGPPPVEALDFFKAKALKPAFNYLDVWREQHAIAFTVAKAMQLDVLTEIKTALDKSLAEGKTFADFKRELRPKLQALGWWGVKEQLDPATGEVKPVQLGSPRRLKVIYDTNVRQAYAAGREEKAQRVKQRFPYAMYVIGPSENHREQHVSWHGLILPVDDPWWDTHTPMNGWGCKCSKRLITARQYERLKQTGIPDPTAPAILDSEGNPTGRKVKRTIPVKTTAPAIQTRQHVNKRTGELTQVPVGIDAGFDTSPAKDRLKKAKQLLQEKQAAFEQLTKPKK